MNYSDDCVRYIPWNPVKSIYLVTISHETAFCGLILLLLWLHLLPIVFERSAGGQVNSDSRHGLHHVFNTYHIYIYMNMWYQSIFMCEYVIYVYLYTYNISCANKIMKKNIYHMYVYVIYYIIICVCIPHTIQHLHRAFWVSGVHHLDASPFSHPKVDQIGVIWTKSNLLPELFLPPHSSRPTVRTLMKQHKGLSNTWNKNWLANYSPRFTHLILSQLVLKVGKYTSWVLYSSRHRRGCDLIKTYQNNCWWLKRPHHWCHNFLNHPCGWYTPMLFFSKAQSCCVLVFKPAFFLI